MAAALMLASVAGPAFAATATGVEVENRATGSYRDRSSGLQVAIESNVARFTVGVGSPGAASLEPGLRFVLPAPALRREGTVPRHAVDDDFVDTDHYSRSIVDREGADYAPVRDGVYIEYTGPAEPDAPTTIDGRRHRSVQLSASSSDVPLQVWLRESRPGSGVYRSLSPVVLGSSTADNRRCPLASVASVSSEPLQQRPGCTLQSAAGDALRVRLDDALQDAAAIDRASRVFDALDGQAIAGARISVMNGKSVAEHPVTGAPLAFVSDARGNIVFPRLSPGGDYALAVEAPEAYRFPSAVSIPVLRLIVPEAELSAASYGVDGFAGSGDGRFAVEDGDRAPVIDVPLDPVAGSAAAALRIDKSVERSVVEVGDSIGYTISLENASPSDMRAAHVDDLLPAGFRYVTGSTRIEGVAAADPAITRDGAHTALRFSLGTLPAGELRRIDYALQAGAAVADGDAVNTARAQGLSADGVQLASSPARAAVQTVRRGAFSDQALLFGKVYVDATCDNVQNRGEWPVPGVRLYLTNGRFVVTDEDGQYSMAGLAPGEQVIKLDPSTLPTELALKPVDTDFAADPGSRFISLRASDFHRADFATACPSGDIDAVFDELERRREALSSDWLLDAASRYDPDGRRPLASATARAGADGDLGGGWLTPGRKSAALADDDVAPASEGARRPIRSPDDGAPTRATLADPESLAPTITAAQAEAGTFLWPIDGIADDGRIVAVVRAGIEPQLFVDDIPVAASQLGERIENRREAAQIAAWYGLRLSPGHHRVEVRGRDAFGNERVLAATAVRTPASAARLVLRANATTLPADGGRSSLPIDLLIADADDVPVTGLAFVTLDTSRGGFAEPDLQPREPGHQVRVENGRAKVHVVSSERAGRFAVTARLGELSTRLALTQLTAARPLIATGLVQAGVSGGSDVDGLERDSRVSLFVNGGVRGDAELTLAYDTDKPDATELLDGLPDDTAYPTTGDASIEGFQAQSRSKLYARLERDRHSIMWGDYRTDGPDEASGLARVQRTLTGANAVFDTGRTRVRAFAAEQSDSRLSETLPGNGTAMLYTLAGAPIVANSEIVERIVVSRDNPGLELSSERLVAGIDYRLDPLTGLLSFADAVPSVDADANPVFVRIGYDARTDTEQHLIAGVRVDRRMGEATVLGAAITEDRSPQTGFTLAGLNARHELGNLNVQASTALMRHADGDEGRASRIGGEYRWHGRSDIVTRFAWARAGRAFDNPGSGVAGGRSEWSLQHRHAFGARTRLVLDALGSRSLLDAARYRSIGFRMERDIGAFSVRAGARRIDTTVDGRALGIETVLLGLQRRFTLAGRPASIGVDVERALGGERRERIALDARIGLGEYVVGYARYERERGLSSRALLGLGGDDERLVAGVESDWLPGTELFSEYRLRGAFAGRALESVSGARGSYTLSDGLTLSPSLEIVRALGGDAQDAVAVSMGISDTRKAHRRIAARVELRRTEQDDYLGVRASVAQRLHRDWTALAVEEFTLQRPDSGENTVRQRLSLGLARRPKHDNRHHALFAATWKRDRTPELDGDVDRWLLSSDQNRALDERWTLSGRLASKWQRRDIGDSATWQRATLARLSASVDVARRWELEAGAGALATGEGRGAGFDDLAWSAGVGARFVAAKNLRLVARWNAVGFDDADLDEDRENGTGFRLGLDLKFDEESLQWLGR